MRRTAAYRDQAGLGLAGGKAGEPTAGPVVQKHGGGLTQWPGTVIENGQSESGEAMMHDPNGGTYLDDPVAQEQIAAVDDPMTLLVLIGGELLEGSGFEGEEPEPEFGVIGETESEEGRLKL
jgi:hypothetical protein